MWRTILHDRFDHLGSVVVSEVLGDSFVLARSSLFMPSGFHRLDFQDRVVRVSRRQRVVRAVRDQVESLEHDLTDQRLALCRSDDTVGHHCPVADLHGHGTGYRPLVLPFVGVGHDGRSLLVQPEAFDNFLREHQAHGSGVYHAVDARASDVGLLPLASVGDDAVARVLQGGRIPDFPEQCSV